MLILVISLLLIILLSRITQKITKVPSTLSVIVYSFSISLFFPDLFAISSEEFDDILYLMLPMILLPDILNISIKELRNNAGVIFYLAVVSVVASIAIAIFVTPYLLPSYSFTIGMLLALFSMLMATDAITVASIMSRFKLPEKLKIYAESEALFNDITALVIFYFIALPLISGGDVTLLSVNYILIKVLIFSTFIGVVIAYLGFLTIKILKDQLDQFIVIYLVVIISFLLAEHFHIAGILSIVSSVLTFKYLVQKETAKDVKNKTEELSDQNSVLELIKTIPAITKREFREYKKEAMFIGVFANAIVFIIIANIVELKFLFIYSKEVLVVFIITTIIRFISISSLVFAIKVPFRWAKTLTLSGTKGALAIVMVHSIPNTFIYKDMFEAVVIGNVLITTFLYTFLLMFHIKFNKEEYQQDIQIENEGSQDRVLEYTKSIVDILKKDAVTKSYNRAFMEDIIDKELARSHRYKVDFSLLILKVGIEKDDENLLKTLGEIVLKNIRLNDYFGKLNDDEYIISTSDTSLSGAVILAEKITEEFLSSSELSDKMECNFGVTEAKEGDDFEMILEKLEDAISSSIKKGSYAIEIEI